MTTLDTTTLGPIHADITGTAGRAKMAREALMEIARSTRCPKAMHSAAQLALADDVTLDRLARLLK